MNYRTGRKQAQGLNRITIIFISIIICAFSILILNLHNTAGQVNAHTSFQTYYKSILIEDGDSLWSMAEEYCDPNMTNVEDYIKEIQQINHLENTTIHSGEYLLIPYYEAVTL